MAWTLPLMVIQPFLSSNWSMDAELQPDDLQQIDIVSFVYKNPHLNHYPFDDFFWSISCCLSQFLVGSWKPWPIRWCFNSLFLPHFLREVGFRWAVTTLPYCFFTSIFLHDPAIPGPNHAETLCFSWPPIIGTTFFKETCGSPNLAVFPTPAWTWVNHDSVLWMPKP